MKRLLNIGFSVIVLGGILTSCNNNDDYETIQSTQRVGIDSVGKINDTMNVFSTQRIRTFSRYQSQCEGFYGYDYVYGENLTRRVTAYKFRTNGNCAPTTYVGRNEINFNPQQRGTYTFKFWKSDSTWITKTIEVK